MCTWKYLKNCTRENLKVPVKRKNWKIFKSIFLCRGPFLRIKIIFLWFFYFFQEILPVKIEPYWRHFWFGAREIFNETREKIPKSNREKSALVVKILKKVPVKRVFTSVKKYKKWQKTRFTGTFDFHGKKILVEAPVF